MLEVSPVRQYFEFFDFLNQFWLLVFYRRNILSDPRGVKKLYLAIYNVELHPESLFPGKDFLKVKPQSQ